MNIGGEWTGPWCCYWVMTLTLLQSRGRKMFRSVLYSVSSFFFFLFGVGVGEGGRDWLGRRKDWEMTERCIICCVCPFVSLSLSLCVSLCVSVSFSLCPPSLSISLCFCLSLSVSHCLSFARRLSPLEYFILCRRRR